MYWRVAVLGLLGCAAPPELTEVIPARARAGEPVELRGRLGVGPSDGSRLGATPASGGPEVDLTDAVTRWLDASIELVLPRDLAPAAQHLYVEVSGVRSNAVYLEVLAPAPPRIEALVPPWAETGGLITVLGEDFGPDEGSVVFAPDVLAPVLSWTESEIVVHMPAAPGADAVRVETTDGLIGEWRPRVAEPRLSVIQSRIFTPTCALTGCHGELPSVGLSLVDGDSHASLVGVASAQLPELVRVDPGSPETSMLVDKLIHDPPAVGQRMPAGSAPLGSEHVALIEEWIRSGALDD